MPLRVSILIPCYNQAHYLPRAVESALAQDWPDLEILIVNDGSTDATHEVAGKYARDYPDRVRLVEQANQGLSMARQAGLDAATGEFFVNLDADDTLEPEMARTCIGVFESVPEADAVVGDAWLVEEEGGQIIRRFEQQTMPRWPGVLEHNPFGAGNAVMTRTGSARRVGGLGTPGLRACEDWDLWIRMARCGMKFVAEDCVLARYRQSRQALSRNLRLMLDSRLRVLDGALGKDPRLCGADLRPAAPISQALYQRLRNGHVFNSLGALAAQGASDEDLRAALGRLVPGALDPDYCRGQFFWGLLHALTASRSKTPPAVLPLRGFASLLLVRMQEIGHGPLGRPLANQLLLIVQNPWGDPARLRRARNRLTRLLILALARPVS